MKGTISVNSVYGKGSEFSFTIPQLIVRDTPCSSLIKNPKHFKIVGFIDHPTVEQNFRHLMNELQLDYIPCSNPDEVISHSEATHLFVSASLYTGTLKDYMDHLPSGIGVIITNHNHFISLPNHLKEIKKPLYCLNVSNILNNVEMLNVERPDMDILNFVAPEARILIVDDNTVNITVTLGLLEPLNMLCDTALSGDEAIAKIKKHQYDIIFMDHMMPVKDGVETTHGLLMKV